MKNGAIYLAGLLFVFISLVHLARLFCPFQVTLGAFTVPEWFSYIGFILFGLVAAFLFRARHENIKAEK